MTRLASACFAAALTAVAASAMAQTADLAILKSNLARCPTPCQGPGSNITYLFTVDNGGPDPAAEVVLSDGLPAHTTFVSLAAPPGWIRTTPAVGSTGTVTSTISSLAAGATSSLLLTVHVDSATPGGSVVTNTGNVSSSTADPDPNNNSATDSTLLFTLPAQGSIAMLDSRLLVLLALGLAGVGISVLRKT